VTSRVLYRLAAVLILLFALGHSIGFPWSDPAWGVDTGAMRSAHFPILGFRRTYWDFYLGFGLFNSVFLLLAAILAWQLGGLPKGCPMRLTAWALAFGFVALTVLAWKYLFPIPIVFSALIALCLLGAAWRSTPETRRDP
jgi:hypothetical protein